jgi:hypothetical protein
MIAQLLPADSEADVWLELTISDSLAGALKLVVQNREIIFFIDYIL